MNRSTKINNQNKLNERELELGYSGNTKKSWHQGYKDSAWIHVNGLDYDFNEGDLLSVFSQYGEIMNVNLIRDYKTLKSKGFAYICYKDQRSTNLAVDNFNGIKLGGRLIQVDHCMEFRPPKYKESVPPEILKIWEEGCAPKPINISKDEIRRDAEEQKQRLKAALAKAEELSPMVETKEERKARREQKKLMKKIKKREKREREFRDQTPPEERGTADGEGRWDKKRKAVDYRNLEDDDFYGASANFNFNKNRKDIPQGRTHNVRPDMEKASHVDKELFKIVRDINTLQHGAKPEAFKGEDYLPQRFGGTK